MRQATCAPAPAATGTAGRRPVPAGPGRGADRSTQEHRHHRTRAPSGSSPRRIGRPFVAERHHPAGFVSAISGAATAIEEREGEGGHRAPDRRGRTHVCPNPRTGRHRDGEERRNRLNAASQPRTPRTPRAGGRPRVVGQSKRWITTCSPTRLSTRGTKWRPPRRVAPVHSALGSGALCRGGISDQTRTDEQRPPPPLRVRRTCGDPPREQVGGGSGRGGNGVGGWRTKTVPRRLTINGPPFRAPRRRPTHFSGSFAG